MATRLRPLAVFFALLGVSAYAPPALAQPAGAAPDALFQGFYWNAHPGDHALDSGGVLWDSIATLAPHLAAAGMQTVWIPSPAKGGGGRWSMGYDPYDYYDLGAVDQKGSVRTRFGTEAQLRAMVATLKGRGLRLMVDAVLNHRDGADAQSDVACVPGGGAPFLKWNVFDTGSGRFPAGPESFHSNSHHCDFDAPYHDAPFGQDLCYFHDLDGTHPGGWHAGPHQLGAVGDSLVAWGRWLVDDLGADEVRLDAIKHIEPGFLAPWLVELTAGPQPFALGEFWDGTGAIRAYHDEVEAFNGTFGGGGPDAQMAMFDFGLRYALRDMAGGGGGYDMSALNSAGLHFETGLDPFSVVTFVENHDVDRIGFEWADCADPAAIPSGTTCVKLGTDSGHDPIVSRKHLAYAVIAASEGRPTIFWKDYLWYGLGAEIDWLLALRRLTGQGESAPMSALAPNPEANPADLWVLRRDGFGSPRYGALLALSDGAEEGAWVDSPHADYELRDYTDGYLFETTRAFADGRAYVKARGESYAWWAPTGLYPRPLDEPASAFALTAEPGGHLHHVVLRAADAASLLVNGAPIQPGDEVAVLAPGATVGAGANVAGLGRVGQRLRWDGQHDMILEALGNADGTQTAGRLAEGDPLRLVVYDASTGETVEAASVTWAPTSAGLTLTPLRPGSMGGPFPIAPTDDSGTYTAGALSVVTGFAAAAPAPAAVRVEAIPHRPRPPVVIDTANPRFRFKVRLRNTTRDEQTVGLWTELVLPDGSAQLSNFRPVDLTVPARTTIRGTYTQKLPASAPAGDYTLRVHIGTHPDGVMHTDSFPFAKADEPAARLAGGSAEGGTWDLVFEGLDGSEPDAPAESVGTLRVGAVSPNPFRSRAAFSFSVPEARPVRVEVLDALGRRVAVAYEGTPRAGETQTVALDGAALPAGVYLVRLTADGAVRTQRVVRTR